MHPAPNLQRPERHHRGIHARETFPKTPDRPNRLHRIDLGPRRLSLPDAAATPVAVALWAPRRRRVTTNTHASHSEAATEERRGSRGFFAAAVLERARHSPPGRAGLRHWEEPNPAGSGRDRRRLHRIVRGAVSVPSSHDVVRSP